MAWDMTHRWADIDGDPGIQPNPPYPMPHVPLDAAYKNHTLRNGQDSTTMVRCNLAIKIIKTRSRMQTTFTHASSNVSIRVEETASNCGTENVCKLEHEPPVQRNASQRPGSRVRHWAKCSWKGCKKTTKLGLALLQRRLTHPSLSRMLRLFLSCI